MAWHNFCLDLLGMRRALRNTETSMFLKSDGSETEFFELARPFENYQEALSFTQKNKLQSVELVVRSGSAEDEFIMALPGEAA